jgi:small subunit ribosomal protein S6
MNKYELIVIINPSVDEEGVKKLNTKFTDIINSNGKVAEVKDLGKKTLAYKIKKQSEGLYEQFDFEADPSSIKELERNLRITDEIMKFMVIKTNE